MRLVPVGTQVGTQVGTKFQLIIKIMAENMEKAKNNFNKSQSTNQYQLKTLLKE